MYQRNSITGEQQCLWGGFMGLPNVLSSAHSNNLFKSRNISSWATGNVRTHGKCSDSLVESDLFALGFDNGTAELLYSSFVISGVLRLAFLRAFRSVLIVRVAILGFSNF